MEGEAAPRPRVLIVDDEESTRLLLARILSADLGAEVQLAGTVEQALRLAQRTRVDAILIDMLMPGAGGLGLLREIRGGGANAGTPVIVVSVLSERETIERCLAAGASAYHVKPVRRAELVATVRAQLAKAGSTGG